MLNLDHSVDTLPELDGFKLTRVAARQVEVDVHSDQRINQLFDQLNQKGIGISSMRNKQNRLEQLFIHMVENSRNGTGQ